MRLSLLTFLFAAVFVVGSLAGNDYLWGEVGPKDFLLARVTVSKAFFIGLIVSKKYVFKQSDNPNAYTITAIKVTDQKKKNGASAELVSGGPGSKGCTIVFKSQRGSGIKDLVEVWGR